MTITVKVLIEGNKAAKVDVVDENNHTVDEPVIVQPGAFVTRLLHSGRLLVVGESGDFLT
jgi:hypothetical protein